MNAFELRLGNYVTIDNPKHHPQVKGVPMQVFEFRSISAIDFPNSSGAFGLVYGDETFSQFDEFVKPIPLTEKWLLDFGFENQDENRYWLDPIFLFYYGDGVKYLANQRHVNLFYVHQLQNLYFAITGQDLQMVIK